jgi:hypothetical protein
MTHAEYSKYKNYAWKYIKLIIRDIRIQVFVKLWGPLL